MAKAELGEKRRCLSCNTAFFDFNRSPILCPKCQAIFVVVEVVRSPTRPARPPAAPFMKPAPAQPVPADVDLLVEEDDETQPPVLSTDEVPEIEV